VEVARKEDCDLHQHFYICQLHTFSDLSHSPSVNRLKLTNQGETWGHEWKKRTASRVLVVKHEWKRPLGRPRSKWYNIQMDLIKNMTGRLLLDAFGL
jgi:hypothetical protein